MTMENFEKRQQRAGMSEDKLALMRLMKRTLRECAYACAALIADAVIADGWVKPVCRVGDTVFIIYEDGWDDEWGIEETTVTDVATKYIFTSSSLEISDIHNEISIEEIGKTVFFSREEAKKALKAKEAEYHDT